MFSSQRRTRASVTKPAIHLPRCIHPLPHKQWLPGLHGRGSLNQVNGTLETEPGPASVAETPASFPLEALLHLPPLTSQKGHRPSPCKRDPGKKPPHFLLHAPGLCRKEKTTCPVNRLKVRGLQSKGHRASPQGRISITTLTEFEEAPLLLFWLERAWVTSVTSVVPGETYRAFLGWISRRMPPSRQPPECGPLPSSWVQNR